MNGNRKYLVAVALLVVLAVIFAFAGTAAPMSEMATTQQESSSNSVTHFQNPPTFDSDWVDITDKCGQYFNITHDLNIMNVTVDITGKTTIDGGVHQRHLGGTDYDLGWSKRCAPSGTAAYAVQTSDGGYVIAGSASVQKTDFKLVKTDWTGNTEWNKTYGGTENDHAYAVVETSEYDPYYDEWVLTGYAIAGDTYSYGTGAPTYSDFWLVKTYSEGTEQWRKNYGGANSDYCYSVVQTSDGGYALAGYTYRNSTNKEDFYLVKTDYLGNKVWERTYGGTIKDIAHSVVETSDGGYAIAGYIGSYWNGTGWTLSDFWLVKTDSDGNMQWNKTYGDANNDVAYSLVQTGDGGYAIGGYRDIDWPTPTARARFSLVKTDATGQMQWSRTYEGPYSWSHSEAYSVIQTSEGGYAMTGTIGGEFSRPQAWTVKTDSFGNLQWNRTSGTNIWANSVIQTKDGGYVLEANDYTLIRLDAESGLAWIDSTANTTTLYRGATDVYWNFVRVRVWTVEEPTWMYGDINQDGVVNATDLYILSQNYGKTFSLLSLSGIAFIAGVRTYKRRKETKATES